MSSRELPRRSDGRWFSLRDLLDEVLAALETGRCGVPLPRMTVDVPQRHAVHADRAVFRRVLESLLANAVESAGPAGEVVVTSVEYADAIELEVADSGPALSSRATPRPFEPRLGGRIAAIDCPEGGAAFTIRLPQVRRRLAA